MKQCSKCGGEVKSEEEYFKNYYCEKCLNRFQEIKDKGAIVIRRRLGRDDNILRWDIHHSGYEPECKAEPPEDTEKLWVIPDGMNQVQAIKKGREWGRNYNLSVIFEYKPHQSIWFLDDYLKAHPKINNDVIRSR